MCMKRSWAYGQTSSCLPLSRPSWAEAGNGAREQPPRGHSVPHIYPDGVTFKIATRPAMERRGTNPKSLTAFLSVLSPLKAFPNAGNCAYPPSAPGLTAAIPPGCKRPRSAPSLAYTPGFKALSPLQSFIVSGHTVLHLPLNHSSVLTTRQMGVSPLLVIYTNSSYKYHWAPTTCQDYAGHWAIDVGKTNLVFPPAACSFRGQCNWISELFLPPALQSWTLSHNQTLKSPKQKRPSNTGVVNVISSSTSC